MPEEKKKTAPSRRISDAQRYRYVGFEVFPGKIKDLFKSDAEREKLIETVRAKRAKADALHALREECTLLEDRVTMRDRIVLAIACAAILVSLFLPWYSVFNEIAVEPEIKPVETADAGLVADSAMMAASEGDSAAMPTGITPEAIEGEAVAATTEGTDNAEPTADAAQGTMRHDESSVEEVIHGYVAKKKYLKEYDRVSGFGSLAAVGSVGSYVFSSGVSLAVTAVVLLLMTIACLLLPLYTLYGLFGMKGDADARALKLKKMLKLNWIPLLLFVLVVFLSFFGSGYSFDAESMYTSIGTGYGPGVLLGSISGGILLALAGSILLALKGVEI